MIKLSPVRALAVALALVVATVSASGSVQADAEDRRGRRGRAHHSRALVFGSNADVGTALAFLKQRGKAAAAAALILAQRYRGNRTADYSEVLSCITGDRRIGWFDWMVWQESHPNVTPHPSFAAIKTDVLSKINPNFHVFFLPPWNQRDRMRIRLEEITWGGVRPLTAFRLSTRPR